MNEIKEALIGVMKYIIFFLIFVGVGSRTPLANSGIVGVYAIGVTFWLLYFMFMQK